MNIFERLRRRYFSYRFAKRKITYSDYGFFFVDPMPTEEELAQYYKESYWGRDQKKNLFSISRRDIAHFFELRKAFSEIFENRSTILNFGSGRFGMSVLARSAGMKVVNCEFRDVEDLFQQGWVTVEKLSEVSSGSIDLIYASHSLEHVTDIKRIINEFVRVGAPNGKFFFEVPNAQHPSAGGSNGMVYPPHTYYFLPKFFKDLTSGEAIIEVFDNKKRNIRVDCSPLPDSNGDVIVCYGNIRDLK